MRKIFKITALAVMAVGLLTGCGSSKNDKADANKVYNFKYECVLNEASPWYKMGQRMAKQMKEKSNGRLNMEVYANAQLAGGNQQKGLENVINNVTQVDCRSSMLWQVMDDKLGVWAIPFFYDSTDQILKDMKDKEGYKAYKKALDAKGLHLAGLVEYGPRPIASNVPIKSYEDMAGKKIRVASVQLHLDALKAFGANPMAMNWSEMYTGLQQGTVSGMEAPYQVMIENTIYDVCKNYYDANWVMDPGVVTVNAKFYNSLPDDLRKIFDEAFEDSRKWEIAEYQKLNKEAKDKIVSQYGCVINPMSDADLQKFKEAMKPVVAAYEQKVGKDYLDLFRNRK